MKTKEKIEAYKNTVRELADYTITVYKLIGVSLLSLIPGTIKWDNENNS